MTVYNSIILFLIGSILASFYGVVATRLPKGNSIVSPRSHCENCNHSLGLFDLMPIFSFVFLRGKCRYCKAKLPIYEPLMEIATGLFFSLSYIKFGFTYDFYISCILISLSVIIYVTDFQDMIILDSPLIISSILIFILKWANFGVLEALYSLLHGLVLFIFMLFIGLLGKKMFKREALGGGDIKLSFVIGEALGIQYALISLVFSTFLALPYAFYAIIGNKSREVPYGPFLASSLWFIHFFKDKFQYVLKIFYI